jgi:prepilin-type processing-associated H-X9-DG protein
MYQTDYERMPYRDGWADAANVYAKAESLFRCVHLPEKTDSSLYGHSFNGRLSRRSLDDLPHAEQMPLVFDSINFAWNASDPFLSFPAVGPENEKRRNIVFADGHAEYFSGEAKLRADGTLIGVAARPMKAKGNPMP